MSNVQIKKYKYTKLKFSVVGVFEHFPKHSANLSSSGFSAKKLGENPKKMAGLKPKEPQLFGCMILSLSQLYKV